MANDVTHLLRTAAGIESLQHLAEVQTQSRTLPLRESVAGHSKAVMIHTRRKPQRANDLLNGGSVYWIIKHMIKARQEILDIEILKDEEDKDFCRIALNPQIILTEGISHRAIQGWRYFALDRAPKDIGPYDPHNDVDQDIPAEMADELRRLGLL